MNWYFVLNTQYNSTANSSGVILGVNSDAEVKTIVKVSSQFQKFWLDPFAASYDDAAKEDRNKKSIELWSFEEVLLQRLLNDRLKNWD